MEYYESVDDPRSKVSSSAGRPVLSLPAHPDCAVGEGVGGGGRMRGRSW